MSIENYMSVTLNKQQVKEMRSTERKRGFDRAVHIVRLFTSACKETRTHLKEMNRDDEDLHILFAETELLEGVLQ